MRSIGDICRVKGLKHDTKINGHLCEILTELKSTTVPEHDGIERTAMRYGVRILGVNSTGWMRPDNLSLELSVQDENYTAMRRACFIHETGWEEQRHDDDEGEEPLGVLAIPTAGKFGGEKA